MAVAGGDSQKMEALNSVVSAVATEKTAISAVAVAASEEPAVSAVEVSAEHGDREVLKEHLVVVEAEAPVALADEVEVVDIAA